MSTNQRKYSVAIVGATGLVGRTMLQVLLERRFPIGTLTLLASERSAGTTIPYKRKELTVQRLTPESFRGIDIALFSAGGSVSREYAPIAAEAGCVAIDNSSAWRMHPEVPLVVPEVNARDMKRHHGIIANPNCSTIQLVVVLQPLHKRFGLQRVLVSTYQSISGAGQKGIEQLEKELYGQHSAESPYPHPIAFNTMFHSITEPDGYSEEEIKMIRETRRIMGLPELNISVTCVRVPTLGGHGESVTIETAKPLSPKTIRTVLSKDEGIVVLDVPERNLYPTPLLADGSDEVFVGRIRADQSSDHTAHMWIVADNVRKGAATNAVQIAEALVERDWLRFKPTSF